MRKDCSDVMVMNVNLQTPYKKAEFLQTWRIGCANYAWVSRSLLQIWVENAQ